jgi:hypothetical protein
MDPGSTDGSNAGRFGFDRLRAHDMTADIDLEWYEKHGSAEQPHDFNRRWMQKQLTDAEIQTTQDCTCADQAFSVLYPEYVSLDQFRQDAWNKTLVSSETIEPVE